MTTHRKPYDSDVSDAEWEFVAPYLTLLTERAGQSRHDLREVLDVLRWLVRAGSPWRLMPHDLPPRHAVYDQARRWMAAGCFEAIVHDLRAFLRSADSRQAGPTAAIIDSRTIQSTPESGGRAGYDGCKRKNGSKAHLAVDTMGRLVALHVTPADEQDRARVAKLCEAMHEATGESVELISPTRAIPARRLRRGGRPGDHPARRQAPRGEEGLPAPALPLGGRAFVRMDGEVPPPGPRLREARLDPGGPALRRLQHPHAPQRLAHPCSVEFVTPSNTVSSPNRR